MRQDTLPPEFQSIAHLVHNVHKKSNNEFCSSCPECGGRDRFVMFRIGRGGFPFSFCRKCPYHYTGKHNLPSKEEFLEWKRNQVEVENARIEAAQRTLEILQSDRVWEQFHTNNNEYSREIFRGWGIQESWVEYLQLGLIPDYTVKSGEEYYHSPGITIPVWYVGDIVQNVKIRVTNPRHDRDRYRNLYPMGQSFLFIPRHEEPLKGTGILVEGERKAIVLEQTLDDPKLRVVGLQTKTPAPELFKSLKDFDKVYVWLDPDAFNKENGRESAVEYVTRMTGKERVLVVDCSKKLDDAIVEDGMNPRRYLRMARKA